MRCKLGARALPIASAFCLLGASACLPPPRDNSPVSDAKADGALDAAGDTTKTTDSGGPGDVIVADVPPSDAATATDAAADASPSASAATGCTTDTPCANLPWGKCKVGTCNLATGLCQAQNAEDGSVCIDDGGCYELPTCQAGTCVGKPKDCDDKNACTLDGCLPGKGCVHDPAVKNCDDGSACTTADHCVGGACTGTPVDCNDADPCTPDTCDPKEQGAAGPCKHPGVVPAGTPCTDNSPCTGPGECVGKTCKGKDLCDDGNPCTKDTCEAGKCKSYVQVAGASCTPVGAAADPCNPGTCQVDLAGSPTCTTKPKCDDGKPCTKDECAGGSCKSTNVELADAVTCDDGNALTAGEMCAKGTCLCGASGVTTCKYDDLNPCTDDKCTNAGCSSTPNSAKCQDGSACTTGDTCKDGKCQGQALGCDDKNPCTQDACDPLDGCTHKVQAGAKCGEGKQCDATGVCK